MKDEEKKEATKQNEVPPQKKNKSSGNVVFAFLLIFLGFLFLANNLGIVSWTVWADLWRFWPIVLILWGLQFLLGKSTFAQIIMAVVTVSLFLFALLYILAGAGALKGTGLENWQPVRSMPMHSNDIVKQELKVSKDEFQNIRERKINIENGVGKFVLQDDDRENYFELQAATSRGESNSSMKANQSSDILTIDVRVPQNNGPGIMPINRHYEYNGYIGQTQIPTDIAFELGAGKTEIDLDTLTLRNFIIEVGAGAAEIELKDNAVPETAKLTLGMGSIQFAVPEQVGLEITYDVGLGNLKIEDQNLKGNGTYRTRNFDQSTKKLRISARVGTGSISFQQ